MSSKFSISLLLSPTPELSNCKNMVDKGCTPLMTQKLTHCRPAITLEDEERTDPLPSRSHAYIGALGSR